MQQKIQEFYKVVRPSRYRPQLFESLYFDSLGKYGVFYSKDKPTDGRKICFVCNTLTQARFVARGVVNAQIWRCEGIPCEFPEIFNKRSKELGLSISKYAFAKRVTLLRKVK